MKRQPITLLTKVDAAMLRHLTSYAAYTHRTVTERGYVLVYQSAQGRLPALIFRIASVVAEPSCWLHESVEMLSVGAIFDSGEFHRTGKSVLLVPLFSRCNFVHLRCCQVVSAASMT